MRTSFLKIGICLLLAFFIRKQAIAHSFPDSKAELYVQQNRILVHFKTPLDILGLAAKIPLDSTLNTSQLDSIRSYFKNHVKAYDSLHSNWSIGFDKIFIQKTDYLSYGKYNEIVVAFYLTPSKAESLKSFYFFCDAITHQIVNQTTLLVIQQDLQHGIVETNAQEIATIGIDYKTNTVLPVKIELGEGSIWHGFVSMVVLGMNHIKEGTDHLLFLLVLLLPSMLLVEDKRWKGFAGTRKSLVKLVKIITSFTIGHSLTLLLGAIGWVSLPSQPVEIIIAVSILVSAIHAIKPLFYGKETYIAGGFGLIHGLAFASVLSNLHLDKIGLVISILGFNLGIECMQLLVVMFITPFLIFVAQKTYFPYIRWVGAVLAALAALFWIVERTAGIF